MAEQDVFEFSAKYDVEIEKSSMDQACRVLDNFYNKYHDRKMKIDTSDMIKTAKDGVSKIQQLYRQGMDSIAKDDIAWFDVEDGLEDQIKSAKSKVEKFFDEAKIMFSDGSMFSVLDENLSEILSDKFSKGITATVTSLEEPIQHIKDVMSSYMRQLKEAKNIKVGRFGTDFMSFEEDMDENRLIDHISLLRELITYQKQLELITKTTFEQKNAPLGHTTQVLEREVNYLDDMLLKMKAYNEEVEESYRLKTDSFKQRQSILETLKDTNRWDENDQARAIIDAEEDGSYNYYIERIQEFIKSKQDAIEQINSLRDELFRVESANDIDNLVSGANEHISKYQKFIEQLESKRDKKVDSPINFSEVVEALGEIKKAIREIKEAFDPLTQAFANEDSAISKMVNANVEDLNRLQEKFEQVFRDIQTISQKDFSSKTTNVVQQTINAPGGILKTQRAELKELAKTLAQYQSAIGDLNSKSNIFKKIGLSGAGQLDFFSFDLNEVLAGLKKATTAEKLDGWADVLDDYKKGIINVANEINKIQSGLVNLDPLQNQKKKDPDIINLGQASSNVDGILTEVKSIRDQIDAEIQGIRASFEDIFKFDSLSPNFDNITSITDKIYQQFEELQNNIKKLDFSIETPNMDGVAEAINYIKQEGQAAESAAPKNDAFTAANQKLADSMKETGDVGEVAADGIKAEAQAVDVASGMLISAEDIVDKYNRSGRKWDKNRISTLNSRAKLIANSANEYIKTAGIKVSSIDTTVLDRESKDTDGNSFSEEITKLVVAGTDMYGKTVKIVQEYNMVRGALEKTSTKYHDAINQFNLETAKSTATSQVKELQNQMGSFKIDLSELTRAKDAIVDEDSFDVFNEKLKNAKQRLGELKATLKSSKSLDPIVNSESMMSNLETTVNTYRENIKKFSDVDGFEELETHLTNITAHLEAFNDAKTLGNGNAMASSVAEVNKEIAQYNSQLNLVKARYQENNRVAKESEKTRKNVLQEEKAILKEIAAEDKVTLDKDKQFSLLSKQAAQWKKNGQLTDETRQKIDLMLDSLTKVTNADELSTWKTQWSIVKNEIMETKYQIEAAQKAQAAIDKADAAAQRKEDEDRAYWDKERQRTLDNLITPEKRPELEQLKSYMLQQAKVTKESVEEQYDALMTIVTNKNKAFQKLMSASGPNEKKHAQDEYSAWFGAWNGLDKDVVNKFFEDAGNQAILGADKIDKFNDAIKESHRLEAKSKDQQNNREQKESEAATKKALAEKKALLAEEKALMKEIVSEEKLTFDKDKQFALLSKQQAQWGKNGQLTDELRQTINDVLDSLAKVTNSDELAIWKKQWSIVKDEVLATKYEIEAASKAQKATADERKASGVYWDKEFQYSLNNIITPEKRPELEQLKVYMLQQAKVTESAVTEQYDAIMTIVKNKNNALQKLMSAKGPNDKQYWQDQYSAWYGAWNKLDHDVVNNFFNDAGNQAILGADKIDKFNDELERSNVLSNKLKDKEYNEGQKKQDKVNKQNQNYGKIEFNQATKFLESMNANVRSIGGTDNISESLNALVQDYTEAYKKIASIRKQFEEDPSAVTDEGLKAKFQDAVLHANNLKKEIQGVFAETQKLESISDDLRLGEAISLDDLDPGDIKSSMIAYINAVSEGTVEIKGFNEAGTEMYGVIDRGNGAIDSFTVVLDKGTNKLHAFTTETNKASNEWEDFKSQAISGAKNLFGMYVGVQEAVQAFRTGVDYVKEIDLAMTELKKVTDETDASYKQFLQDAGSTSAIIGSTISDFTEATATFARLGYTLEESTSMAETAIIYKNVADGLDSVEESSESIISTMMAFGIEANDTMSIIDRFNAVGKICADYKVA